MKDAGYCDGTYETLSLCAHTGLFEKLLPICWIIIIIILYTIKKLLITVFRNSFRYQNSDT